MSLLWREPRVLVPSGSVHSIKLSNHQFLMKTPVLFLLWSLLALSCGGRQEEKKDSFEVRRVPTETKSTSSGEALPVDLNNKGVGPVKTVDFSAEIDQEMAAAGKARFAALCMTCHTVNRRMIGPAMQGIYERRSPEWVMNMILNPEGMLKEDPIARALLKEYNNAVMLNQNLTEAEARAILEYLRTL